MKAPIEKIQQEIDKGYVKCQRHPHLPLTIYNYTDRLQSDWKMWNETNKICRGLVLDDDYNIVAKSLDKFFTLEQGAEIPDEDFVVYEKMDGSMILLFLYQDDIVIATRGSFVSDQVGWADEILCDKYLDFCPVEGYTYVFELVHFKDRKIVRYDSNDLYILTVVDARTGKEVEDDTLFPRPKIHSDYKDIKNLPYSENATDAEGYVIRFDSGYRIKAKSPAYVQAHRVYYGMNKKRVWEMLKDGRDVYEIIEGLPDEFYREVKQMVNEFECTYQAIESDFIGIWLTINSELSQDDDRKTWALRIQQEDQKYHGILFAKLSGKDYKDVIWKQIKPKLEE